MYSSFKNCKLLLFSNIHQGFSDGDVSLKSGTTCQLCKHKA